MSAGTGAIVELRQGRRCRPEFSASYPAISDAVAPARSALVAYVRGLGAPEGVLADIGLAASEACTNAVVHAYAGARAGSFRVEAEPWGVGRLRVAVSDEGDGMRPRPDSPGLGLGLPVMSALAETFDLRSEPGGGTAVTMTFVLEAAEGPAADEPADRRAAGER